MRSLRRAFPWIIAALAFAVIAPALRSGWIGDDAFYSVLDGILGADRISLWHAMAHAFDLWFNGVGRFYPGLIAEKYLVFAIFTNLVAYKALLVVATLATVEMFRRCVGAYAGIAFGNLAALVAVSLLALRGYHDPILSYNAMLQLVAIALFGSLIAFRRVVIGTTLVWKVIAVALYALAALTYEDAYGFALLYCMLAAWQQRSWRAVIRSCWPYLTIATVLGCVSIVAHVRAAVPSHSPYGFNPAPIPLLRAFAYQLLAAIPLSYYAFDPSGIFSRANLNDFFSNAPLDPLLFLAVAAAMAYALKDAIFERIDVVETTAIGVAAIVLAAAPIAALPKYQSELRPGLGYLPVLYEELAVALILAGSAIATLQRRDRAAWHVGWTVAIATIATFTAATNVRVVRENLPAMAARLALEHQLDAGLLAGVADGTFVTTVPQDWIAYDGQGPEGISTRGLFFLHGHKRIALVPPSDRRVRIELWYQPALHRWEVRRHR